MPRRHVISDRRRQPLLKVVARRALLDVRMVLAAALNRDGYARRLGQARRGVQLGGRCGASHPAWTPQVVDARTARMLTSSVASTLTLKSTATAGPTGTGAILERLLSLSPAEQRVTELPSAAARV